MRFNGKVVLVTGASRGIGSAIALAFAREGADVAVNYLNDGVDATSVCNRIRELGRRTVMIATDVANHDNVAAMMKAICSELGAPDILVNNAGINRDRSLLKLPDEDWQRVLDVNLTGVYNCTKALLPAMYDRGSGAIVSITSVIAHMGNFGQANYAASKAGIIGFTRSVAREAARKGVRVNAIAPGFINTAMLQTVPEPLRESILEATPLRRFGTPDDVAQAVLFLASDAAGFITGEVLNVNGGYYLH